MNLKQLEQIKEKIDEIKLLIADDPIGCYPIERALKRLEVRVNDEIQAELWSLYRSGRLRIVEEETNGSE
ncbi:MAG: hypothetical protein DRJ38_00355 [Thermoprotei archaeon]|nr:MAG: hypothetical protein DRJ38_00355 [Thermoprotei archaeon]